jgi:hypothetical protein
MDEKGSSPRRRGRPPLSPGAPKRASFNTRLREALKGQLETAAEAAGRSLSEEIEFRLEQSFQAEEALGGPRTRALFRSLANLTRLWKANEPDAWLDDIAGYDQISHAWKITIDNYAPPITEQIKQRFEEGRQAVLRLINDDYPTSAHRNYDKALCSLLSADPSMPRKLCLEFERFFVQAQVMREDKKALNQSGEER